jgi:hypothetical protein
MSSVMPEEILEALPAEQDSRVQDWNDGWAKPVHSLDVDEVPQGITAMNIQGRHPLGALQGFGQLWKKTYQVKLSGLQMTPAQVMQVWKEKFPQFQPPGNAFYPPKEGVEPGKVMFINSPLPVVPPRYNKPGIVPMMSGVMILYADEESFSVMTPEGFPVAGWNNFSVFEEEGDLVAQVQSFERASDPIYEFGFRLMGGAARQEFIWVYVLTSLARYLGIQAEVSKNRECLDPGLQWRYARNIWQNAGIRTTLYTLASPFRWFKKYLPGW